MTTDIGHIYIVKGASHNEGKEMDTKLSTQKRILKVKAPESFSLSDATV